jgi:hypothetical protein
MYNITHMMWCVPVYLRCVLLLRALLNLLLCVVCQEGGRVRRLQCARARVLCAVR